MNQSLVECLLYRYLSPVGAFLQVLRLRLALVKLLATAEEVINNALFDSIIRVAHKIRLNQPQAGRRNPF